VKVTVAYADAAIQREVAVEVPAGACVADAIAESGILDPSAALPGVGATVGVWGKVRPLGHVLREQDRVEIYRPLQADPKDARRKRAGQ
jgi:hypothetical protein